MVSTLNSKPLVSISCITYNHVNYIEEALNSFLMQKTNFNFEVLIHDDASTDGTEEIIRDYEKRFPTIIKPLYEETNQWVKGRKGSAVFNFPRAKGKYIALCEGDDYWTDPLKLQKQVDFLENNEEFSGCFHNTLLIDEREINPSLKPWRIYNKDIFNLEDTISTTALFHTSSFMFKRINLKTPKWLRKVQSVDMALFSLIGSKGLIYRIDEFMSVYRKSESGITSAIKIEEYHKNRIKLNLFFKKSFDVHVHKKIDKVIKYHTSELDKEKRGFFKKLKALIKF